MIKEKERLCYNSEDWNEWKYRGIASCYNNQKELHWGHVEPWYPVFLPYVSFILKMHRSISAQARKAVWLGTVSWRLVRQQWVNTSFNFKETLTQSMSLFHKGIWFQKVHGKAESKQGILLQFLNPHIVFTSVNSLKIHCSIRNNTGGGKEKKIRKEKRKNVTKQTLYIQIYRNQFCSIFISVFTWFRYTTEHCFSSNYITKRRKPLYFSYFRFNNSV